MAITSEIIGKLGGGGAEVEVTPVSGVASGHNGSQVVIATVDVPAGETWLVAAIGQTTAYSGNTSLLPRLRLGKVSTSDSSGTHGLATTATETVSLSIVRNNSSGSDSFTGHVYTVKL